MWRRMRDVVEADVGREPRWRELRQQEPAARQRFLSEAEKAAVLAELPDGLAALMEFALVTGARVTSARLLTWSDVFEDAIVLRDVKSRRRGEVHRLPRTLELNLLLARMAGQHAKFVFTYVCRQSRGARRRGERYPFSRDGWRKDWAAARKSAGVPDIWFHDARRTAGYDMTRATKNLRLTQELLGHADIATTARIYSPVLTADLAAGMRDSAGLSRTGPGKETAPPEGEAVKLLILQKKGRSKR